MKKRYGIAFIVIIEEILWFWMQRCWYDELYDY